LWAAFFPGWGWLAWLALVPLLGALDGAGLRRGAILGGLFGVAFFGLQFSSLSSLWPFVGPIVVLVCVLLAAYGGLFLAAFGALAGRWSSPVVWAGGWVLIEALRAAGLLGFTFGSVPATMAGSPLVPAAAFGGPWLLSLGLAWTAACLARGLRQPRWLAGAILGPLLLFGLAQLPDGTREAGEIRIALVQPNISKAEQLDPSLLPNQPALYREMLAGIAAPVDLIALPENALPWVRQNPEHLALLQEAGARVGAQVLVGTGEFRDGNVYNTTLVLSPAGEIVGSYAKTRLVPFGERVPWREFWTRIGFGPLIDPFLPYDLTPGETVHPVGNIGITICFESTFPGISRDLARQGAEVLITPTNDAWFGRTRILWEHYALGSLRAPETGRSFVQVAQTGISGVWDHRGRELGRFPPWTRGVIVLDVPLRSGQTPYVRFGDGPVLGIAGLLVVVGLMAKRPRAGRGRRGRLRDEI
jgi:apolipoprotein N-acyltransferase